jgi:hypothetical protein
MNTEINGKLYSGLNGFTILALSALLTLGGVTFTLLKERMDKQELRATEDISALREEIKTTKADAKDAVSAAAVASKDAVAATASALKDAVAATAAASTASVTATAVSAKDAVAAIASALSEKITLLDRRVEKIEDRDFVKSSGGYPVNINEWAQTLATAQVQAQAQAQAQAHGR